ncbi:hypothetical protein EU546_00835 [Candidatus Thorarchaeota archaeon]|nr:MAG: hypothetical protein EU546_00835 [Candidatus Thorarchaeota archaeon]
MSEDEVHNDTESEGAEGEVEEEVLVAPSGSRLSRFLEDPWPTATFVLVLLGFAMVILPPYEIWSQWNWLFVGLYFMWILVTISFVFTMEIWVKAAGSKMRFVAIILFLLITGVGVLGSVDLGLWILFSTPVLPGLEAPLLYGTNAIVIFCLYSLWLIKRSTTADRP